MEWKSATVNDQGLYKLPKRWLFIHYYEALNILFRFENSLRVFVYAVLKSTMDSAWKDCSFSSGGEDSKNINSIASKRISQAENFGYLGYSVASPVMHLTSGELIDLLTAEAHWPKFKRYFKGSKEIIKNKLLEIGSVRNSIAHFRPIRQDDVELIKQNSRHVLAGIEECLAGVFNQSVRVPTNTKDAWYEAISTLGNDHVAIIPYASDDGEWIEIRLKFSMPVLETNEYSTEFYSYTVGTINTPNILSEGKNIRRYVTCLSESLSYPTLDSSFQIDISKNLHFVFPKPVLEAQFLAIVEDLKTVLLTISEECDLLQNDNLARGALVESARCTAYYSKPNSGEPRWQFHYDALWKGYESHHPDEYWGRKQYASDVVGGTTRYPWMPDDISEQEGFLD